MTPSWMPAEQTVVQLGGESVVMRRSEKPSTSEEAFANCGWEEDVARWIYEAGGAGVYGIPKNVTEEALRSDGISRQDYAESEHSDVVTKEDWQKIRKLLGSQGLRVQGQDIDAATEFKENVVPMMQFEKEQLCDFTAEPGPKQPRYGAGQVHKYRKPAKIVPREAKTITHDEMELMWITSQRGIYLFLPASSTQLFPEETPKKEAGQISTIYTERIDVTESKQTRVQAGWAWYRTALLYEQSATNLVVGGQNQKALGLWSMGDESKSELLRVVLMLRLRAKRARQAALRKAPDVIDYIDSPPAWAFTSSERDEYWKELFYNGEKVRRAQAAKEFKDFAFVCICEAISTYLLATEDKSAANEAKQKGLGYSILLFAGADSLPKLWEKATQWLANTPDRDQHGNSSEERKRAFRQWWLRGVMARGHAEWLTQELSQDPVSITDPAWKPTESWRFLPPPPLECFDNNCQVDLTMKARYAISKEHDDEYFSKFNGTQLQMRDLDSRMTGVAHYGFTPGCPDFVYASKARTGWAGDTLGLASLDVSNKNTGVAYHNLFLRSGLVDTLPSEASPFDRDLALCADGIVLEWEWDYFLSIFGHMDEREKKTTMLLRKLEESVSSCLDSRRKVTMTEATDTGFEERLYDAISSFLTAVETDSEITYNDRMTIDHQFAVKTQWSLRRLLVPWAHIDIYLGLHQHLVVELRHFESHRLFRPCQRQKQTPKDKVNVLIWERWDMICLIFRRLELVRTSILRQGSIAEEHVEFASCFRKYLESGGDESTLPIINSGTDIGRIQTPDAFRRKHMSALPHSSKWESERIALVRRARLRQSDDPTAMMERFKIKKYFSDRGDSAYLQQVPRLWQLIDDNATAPGASKARRPPPARSRAPPSNPQHENPQREAIPRAPARKETASDQQKQEELSLVSSVAVDSRPQTSRSAPASGTPPRHMHSDDAPPLPTVATRPSSAHAAQATRQASNTAGERAVTTENTKAPKRFRRFIRRMWQKTFT